MRTIITLTSKLLILIPFCYLLYNLILIKDHFDPFYFYGFYGLSVLGLIGSLINYRLGIVYLLISFSVYSYFYDLNVYNLWAVGGLILLISREKINKVEPVVEPVKVEPIKVNKPKENKPKENKESKKKINKVVEDKPKVLEKARVEEKSKDDFWTRYDSKKKEEEDNYWKKYEDKNKFNKIKKKLIKLISDPYGIN